MGHPSTGTARMARKKTARKAGSTTTRAPGVGTAPRPTLASGPLHVTAQGAILKDDDRLILAVRVLDQDGKPVTGLAKQHFKCWQLGHFFSALSNFFVVEIDNIPGLEGMYQLVRPNWSMVGNGTIPFYVRVAKGGLRTGGALTFIVKVREGLDT